MLFEPTSLRDVPLFNMTPSEVHRLHAPVKAWFQQQGWAPQAFQEEVWEAFAQGHNGLLQAPTGSGKTYAAMGHVLSAAAASTRSSRGVKLVWVAPLRALSADIADAARAMVGLGLDWGGTRTGDTSARRRPHTALPDILITTPESLHILIAQKGGVDRLSKAQAVVVERMNCWDPSAVCKSNWRCPGWPDATQKGMRVWGISATLAEPELALEALVGSTKGALIRADIHKDIEIESTMPQAFAKLPWAGHIGLQLLDEVAEVVEAHQSTLIFTNTRRQAEVWYQALLDHKPEWAGLMAMHHGSIARELREWVEDALHDGRLRAVVCTASLDLGVDFRPVDAVVQVGGPKGVSRMIQRAGRCGHRPGEVSKAFFVPTHGLELIEAVALREAIAHGEIEPKTPVILCWDVLVQWLCTLSVGDGFQPDEVRSVLAQTHAYGEMEEDDWRQCLDLISTGWPLVAGVHGAPTRGCR